jgi:predicted NUDIX family phosphoesterase
MIKSVAIIKMKVNIMTSPLVQKQTQTTPQHHDEMILVVKRSHLFTQGDWSGFKQVDFDHYLHIINHKKEFHPRSLMETNPLYKQIIPYLIFEHDNKYFLMQRQSNASESRLRNKLTLGIGGHIRQEDMIENSLFAWAEREFHEEVSYNGTLRVTPLGMINDDSDDVGKVHIGFAFLISGDNANISVKSELKSGILVSLDDCIAQKECMESWSSYIIDFLQTQQGCK